MAKSRHSLRHLDHAIEAFWLTGLATVPLAFRGREVVAFFSQPKVFLLHLAAIAIVSLWLIEWATGPRAEHGSIFDRIERWLGRTPARWAIAAALAFGFAAVLSTLLSPTPLVSVWGRDQGNLGYELYSTLSYLIIFSAIALRARRANQLLRIAYVVCGAGTLAALYGVSQHFGWDPIGRGADLQRVISSLSNPIFFGSHLVMTIPFTLALALLQHIRGSRLGVSVAVVAAGIQIAALWFTGSRGPWIGTFISLIALLVLFWLAFGRRGALTALASILAAMLIATIVIYLPADTERSSRGLDDLVSIPGEIIDAIGHVLSPDDVEAPLSSTTDGPSAPAPAEIIDAIGHVLSPDDVEAPLSSTTDGPSAPAPAEITGFPVITSLDTRSEAFGGRAGIWRGTAILLASRERPVDEAGLITALRHLFGYGPDMYFYSSVLEAKPVTFILGIEHAHSYLLQVWAEQGLFGLLSIIAVTVAVGWAGFRALRSKMELWVGILLVGTLAALIGRSIEQIVGVGRISDLMLMWALLGLVIALSEFTSVGTDDDTPPERTRVRKSQSRRGQRHSGLRTVPLLVAGSAVIFLAFFFVTKDVQSLRAGVIAANGFEQKAAGDADSAFRSFERAADLAPDVERYRLEIERLLTRTALQKSDPEQAIKLLFAARDHLLIYEERDPQAWETQLGLAALSAELASRGDNERAPEIVERYSRVSQLMPAYPTVQALAAEHLVRCAPGHGALRLRPPTRRSARRT